MLILICFLTILIFLNLITTQRVAKYGDDFGNRKLLLYIAIWFIPFFGALMAFDNARPPQNLPEGKLPLRSESANPDAPLVILASSAKNFDVLENMALYNGIPILDWKALKLWADSNSKTSQSHKYIEDGRKAWLLHLREVMGEYAYLNESEDSLILSTLEPELVEVTAKFISNTQKRICSVLKNLASFPANEKCIVVIFDSEEDYYQYVSVYYPDEGEFALSGGMFIDAGCPHFVTFSASLLTIEPVIAHEMTHLALSTYKLPKWLDEGIAVNTELRLTGNRNLIYTPVELHQKHLNFWNSEIIQEFWSGKSFDRTDDGNLLSYELARIIVEQMSKDWNRFTGFVKAAQRKDGGFEAANSELGIDIGSYASAILEMQNTISWTPNPSSWN